MHVDTFIDDYYGKEEYARWFLFLHRLPAVLQADFKKFIDDFELFCTYEGERYRCTGASRMGDVWLTADFDQDTGYQKRVDLSYCSDWAPETQPVAAKAELEKLTLMDKESLVVQLFGVQRGHVSCRRFATELMACHKREKTDDE